MQWKSLEQREQGIALAVEQTVKDSLMISYFVDRNSITNSDEKKVTKHCSRGTMTEILVREVKR